MTKLRATIVIEWEDELPLDAEALAQDHQRSIESGMTSLTVMRMNADRFNVKVEPVE